MSMKKRFNRPMEVLMKYYVKTQILTYICE